jgi:hypothetical protein
MIKELLCKISIVYLYEVKVNKSILSEERTRSKVTSNFSEFFAGIVYFMLFRRIAVFGLLPKTNLQVFLYITLGSDSINSE